MCQTPRSVFQDGSDGTAFETDRDSRMRCCHPGMVAIHAATSTRRPAASWDPQASPSPDGGLGVLIPLTETPADTIATPGTERRKRAYGFEAHGRMPLRKEQHGRPQGQQAGKRADERNAQTPWRAPDRPRSPDVSEVHRSRTGAKQPTASSRTSIDKQRPHAHG